MDSYERFELCRRCGFDLYGGRFFAAPRDEGGSIPANRLATVRLLGRLQDPAAAPGEIEEIVATDLALSYRLLRYANSAFIGLNRQVDSIGHAVKLVGLDRIRLWASLLLFAKLDDKPRELMITALVRAGMCERLAASAGDEGRETFFTIGLLSVLDALLDRPMDEALDHLPLSERVRAPLIEGSGPTGEALACALAYEDGRWDRVRYRNLRPMAIRSHYLDAIGWARRISEGLMI